MHQQKIVQWKVTGYHVWNTDDFWVKMVQKLHMFNTASSECSAKWQLRTAVVSHLQRFTIGIHLEELFAELNSLTKHSIIK
jgi:hypothetical protein